MFGRVPTKTGGFGHAHAPSTRSTATRAMARKPSAGMGFSVRLHRWSIPPHGGAVSRRPIRTLGGSTLKHEGRRQTDRRAAYAGSRLKLIDASGRSRLIRQPFSRNGENSPYGMLGGIVETSASFEARSAPRSYPTEAEIEWDNPFELQPSGTPALLMPS
jgi:hypothetical protein